jgi:hypothetical protein
LSVVCVNVDVDKLRNVLYLCEHLKNEKYNFEIIIVNSIKFHEKDMTDYLRDNLANTFYYLLPLNSIESLITSGIEIAVGDLIIEFYNTENLVEEFDALIKYYENDLQDVVLYSRVKYLPDKFMSLIFSLSFGFKVKTILDFPRISNRDSLSPWLDFKSKYKTLKFLTYFRNGKINYRLFNKKISNNHKRHLRKCLRTLIYGSTFPLRMITLISILGSILSLVISFSIVVYSLNKNVVEGWTTTNLISSLGSFLVLSTLGVISEYLNQVISNTRSTNKLNVILEVSSNSQNFHLHGNVEEM